MWMGRAYPAHAAVVDDASLLAVPRQTLRRALRANPELAMGMLAGLSAKLHEFAALIERLSLMEVPARLADVLLRMRADQGSTTVRLRQTKRQLAAQIGTAAETLSRALAKLKSAGLIDIQGAKITILNEAGLRDAAGGGQNGRLNRSSPGGPTAR